MKKITVGIDASNLRQGGGITHITELLKVKNLNDLGVCKIIIWANKETLNLIENQNLIKKRNPKILNSNSFKRIFWHIFFLSREAHKEKCDILFVPGGLYLGSFRPIVTMSRNLLPFESKAIFRNRISVKTLRLFILKLLQTYSFRNADGTIFLTNYAYKIIERYTGNLKGLTTFIPHGVNKKFHKMPRQQFSISSYTLNSPFRLLYVSTISPYKNQINVVKAVDKLRKNKGWHLSLDLVGPADNSISLKEISMTIKTIDNKNEWLKYKGPVSHKDLISFYEKANLGIFASSCENMPNILIEMMAMGIPIASSDKGPMKEILGDAGVYYNPEIVDEIAGALEVLIKNSKLRASVASKGFELSKKFNWKKCANKTFNFLNLIFKRHIQFGNRNF